MPKPALVIALLAIPVLLIIAGYYFQKDILYSIGYVVLIFYVLLAIRAKLSTGKKNNP